MNLYLFAGQDILVPEDAKGPGSGGPSGRSDPAGPGIAGPLPEAAAASAIGSRAFESGGSRCAAYMLSEEGAALAASSLGLVRIPVRQSLSLYGEISLKAALRGLALLRALEVARFCGACGAPLRDAIPERAESGEPAEDPGARVCDACGRSHFPRISPAVIVLVRKGPKALLAHNARFPQGRFGLLAGFVEAGESLEEAAVREVREEAGIEIRNLRYAKSQPWPFPDSLMAAFTAEWASGEERPDGEEITELRWCAASELPDIPPAGSVARWLIDAFLKG